MKGRRVRERETYTYIDRDTQTRIQTDKRWHRQADTEGERQTVRDKMERGEKGREKTKRMKLRDQTDKTNQEQVKPRYNANRHECTT